MKPTAPAKEQIEARSAFRQQLRRFERLGEDTARSHGITFPQYLLLLHVKGTPGRDWATVGELAQKLILEHHSVVGLASRCEAAGLVKRKRSAQDGRQVEIHLTAKGERTVMAVLAAQSGELRTLASFVRAAARGKPRRRAVRANGGAR